MAGVGSMNFLKPGQEFCDGKLFWCNEGHCCGKGRCCAYYYELWWFWMIWALVILLSCCCLYQQKRFRHRRQYPSHRTSRGRSQNISRPVPVTDPAVISPIFDPVHMDATEQVRLPTYDEAKDMPKEPPAYNLLYQTTLPHSQVTRSPMSHNATQIVPHPRNISDAPQASLLDNEEMMAVQVLSEAPWEEPPPPYTPPVGTSSPSVCVSIPATQPITDSQPNTSHPTQPITDSQPNTSHPTPNSPPITISSSINIPPPSSTSISPSHPTFVLASSPTSTVTSTSTSTSSSTSIHTNTHGESSPVARLPDIVSCRQS